LFEHLHFGFEFGHFGLVALLLASQRLHLGLGTGLIVPPRRSHSIS
jgi:hypothetical protein